MYKFCCFLNENEDAKTKFKSFFNKMDDVSFSQLFDEKKYFKDCEDCYFALQELIDDEKNDKNVVKPRISYYFGSVGVYTLGTSIFYEANDKKKFYQCIEKILETKKIISKSPRAQFYDELLYGVSGYLYCLLTLQQNFQIGNIKSADFRINLENYVFDLVSEIIERGLINYNKDYNIELVIKNLNALPEDFHLVYTFHDKAYFGGAHGYFGVINMLYTAFIINRTYFENFNKEFTNLFLELTSKSLAYYLKLQMKSGNFPSGFARLKKDLLVQFCHGSTGAISPLILALNIHANNKALIDSINISLLKACENIWSFGLLKKGYGLCHGISGNGYSLLNYYVLSKDVKWLYRSIKFALGRNDKNFMKIIEGFEFEDRYITGKSDNPYSLMMGLAGDIIFMLHIFFPELAK